MSPRESFALSPETDELPPMSREEALPRPSLSRSRPKVERKIPEFKLSSKPESGGHALLLNLIDELKAGDSKKKDLASKVEGAQSYWLQNREEIVEGVLNTADDVSKTGYVDGSGSKERASLGETVRLIGDQELEKKVRDLLKEEMKDYFNDHKIDLAEKAIRKAPSIKSLFEVVKRFGVIDEEDKEKGGIYERERLSQLFEPIINIDNHLNELLNNYRQKQFKPSQNELGSLYSEAIDFCRGLPHSLDIRNETLERLVNKINQLKFIATKESEVPMKGAAASTPRPSPKLEKTSWASRLAGRVRGWFGR